MIVNYDSSAKNPIHFEGTSQLSSDTLTHIFLSLDFSSLKICPQVCKQWKNIVVHPHFQYAKRLLEKKYGKAGSDHLHNLIHNKQLTLGNVIQYAPLIKFLNSASAMCSLNDIEYMENFEDHVQMPFCFNDWQNIAFTIDNSTILVDNLKKTNSIALKPATENDINFIRVCMIDDFVFGLCSNGKIIQWDFQSGNQIQIIETGLYQLDSKDIPSIIFSSVGDNLFLSYSVPNRGTAITEIISYQLNSEKNSLIITSDAPLLVEAVEEQQIYMRSDILLLIFDKEKNSFVDRIRGGRSVLVTKEYIFAHSVNGYIDILNRNSKYQDTLSMPAIEGDVIKSKLFDYHQQYLICFSTSVHNNSLSQYVTIWHIESKERICHSIAKDSVQDMIAILESGQLNQTMWKASGLIKESAEDVERFFHHRARDAWDIAHDIESFVKDKTEDCIIS
jgi:F-box domain